MEEYDGTTVLALYQSGIGVWGIHNVSPLLALLYGVWMYISLHRYISLG